MPAECHYGSCPYHDRGDGYGYGFTGAVYVFQSNVQKEGNRWNEPGYGWGVWIKLN